MYCGINQLTAALPQTQPSEEISIEDFDVFVNEVLQSFNVPGVAIGMVLKDQIIFSQGYGYRKVDKQLPVTESMLFPIASCTKAFTSFLLAQLVDENKLAFDDPVVKYVPEFSLLDEDLANNVTIRDLLAHRTGVVRHDPIWVYLEFPRVRVISLLKYFQSNFGLRQKFQYNNFMYTIAGIVIERVTQQSWEEALRSRLLQPLEMKDTNSSIEQLQMSCDFSCPYAEVMGTNIEIPFRNLHSINPGGGINSNIIDMTKWIRLQLSKSKTLQEMQSIQMPFSLDCDKSEVICQLGYGLGWMIGKYRGIDFINHGGDIDGFSSDVSLLPTEGLGIVILTNSSTNGHYVISCIRNHIIDKLLKKEATDWVKKAQIMRNKTKVTLQESLDSFSEIKKTSCCVQNLHDYVGFYQHPSYDVLEVNIEDSHLIVSFGTMKLPLYCKSESVFTGQSFVLLAYGINPLIDFTFFRDKAGMVYQVQVPFENFRLAEPILFIKKDL